MAAEFERIHMNVVQHAGMTGDVKFVSALTMEAIADAVVDAGLAGRAETDRLTAAMFDFAAQPHTICASPRIFEVRATAPSGI
jgi:hypothetical protein